MYQYGYALEKFGRAIYYLTVGEDEIRQRLLTIFQGDLLCITPEHLPTKIKTDYEWIIKQIHKYDETYKGQRQYLESIDQGREKYGHLLPTKLEVTMKRIHRKTASKIASKLYGIWEVLEEDSRKIACNKI